MATLHNEYNNKETGFNGKIRLTKNRIEKLTNSRKSIKKKIRTWFADCKPNELQPKFWGQGSFEMKTIINPIPVYDEDDNKLLKYDLDYGVYFIENKNEDNRRAINTWHDWIYESAEDHTDTPPQKKNTCVRVLYADGHHIDLPIYYKNNDIIELAHKSKGWIESDPKEFNEWFNDKAKANQQLRRVVRYLKAWKNFREINNSNLNLPSGFALTILAANNFISDDNDDISFRETVREIKKSLDNKFECRRPTTPKNEDVFLNYSETRKNNFLNTLKSLINDCDRAKNEKNFKIASEYLRDNQFGDRFPLGKNESEDDKSNRLSSSVANTGIIHRPYYG
jgi:cyclic GMP-AMP synthase DncV-like protein